MSKRSTAVLAGVIVAAVLLACDRPGGNDIGPDFEQIPSAHVPIATATLGPVATRSATPVASGSTSASAATSGSAPAGSASAAGASASGSGSAAPKPPAKVFDCGDKGKPDCPMQKWMKGVAGGAVASGDNERLAKAFLAMSRPPPGMGAWAGICATGAAKAQAGDFDGAKAQCKVCHSKYQGAYHANLRDMKWP